ncbi:hypothetical protein FNX44_027500 [Streptomyces sp. OF1]|uniref:Uncharacterized protein n=1 Tax=Streptomyces alkaliterrae TaxID=2213162 RepID=A0A5P0YZ20_9ACTN|nr:hypothetical protein [Streptomyces alkaliterrae]
MCTVGAAERGAAAEAPGAAEKPVGVVEQAVEAQQTDKAVAAAGEGARPVLSGAQALLAARAGGASGKRR